MADFRKRVQRAKRAKKYEAEAHTAYKALTRAKGVARAPSGFSTGQDTPLSRAQVVK